MAKVLFVNSNYPQSIGKISNNLVNESKGLKVDWEYYNRGNIHAVLLCFISNCECVLTGCDEYFLNGSSINSRTH